MATIGIKSEARKKYYIPPQIIVVVLSLVGFLAVVAASFVSSEMQLMALFLPFAIVAGVVAILRPQWAMFATIAIIPFEQYPLPLPGGLSIMKIVGGLLIVSFLLNIIFGLRKFRFLDDGEDFMIILLAVTLLISVVLSEYMGRSLDGLERIFRMFILYIAVKNLIQTPESVKKIMYIMSTGFTLASWYGINKFFAHRNTFIHDTRVAGVEMDPNMYAMLAAMALMITLTLFTSAQNKWLKLLLIINTASLGTGLLLAGSRSALLALGLGFVVLLIHHPQRKKLVLIGFSVIVLSFPVWPESIKARLGLVNPEQVSDVYTETADESVNRRVAYVEFGLQSFEANMLLGTGYNTFAEYFPRSDYVRYNSSLKADTRREAHNTYLEMFFGAGLIGLTVYVLTIGFVMRDLWLISQKSDYGTLMWSMSTGFLLVLVVFSLMSLFLTTVHLESLWITIGIAAALRYFVLHNPQLLYRTGAQAE